MKKFGSPKPDQNSLTFPDSRQKILKFPDFPEGNIFLKYFLATLGNEIHAINFYTWVMDLLSLESNHSLDW